MSKKQNQKNKVGVALILILIVGLGYFVSQNYSLELNESAKETKAASPTKTSVSTTSSTHQDLGQIPMSEGIKQLSYSFKNDGDQPLQLNNLYTSCMCTKAKIIIDGQESDFAGMKGHKSGLMPIDPNMELSPGQKAELLVEFDPNAHGPKGVGPMTRSVVLETNDTGQPQMQFTFAGVIIK